MHRAVRASRFPHVLGVSRASRVLQVTVALLVAALSAAFAVLLGGGGASATVYLAAGASTSHPYSDPVWYPLRGSYATMDCAASNPGCASYKLHKDQAMTMLSRHFEGKTPIYAAQPVYAAGAGILHIGNNVGDRCQNPSTLGTWVWVDHGGGLTSRYGHLNGILSSIHDGEYVTPATVIGYTGHSGEKTTGDCNRATHYLNFRVTTGGVYGTGVRLTSLKVCVHNKPVWWPSKLRSKRVTSFQRVPQKAVLDNSHQSPTSCVGRPAAYTPTAPLASSFHRSGKHGLRLNWQRHPGITAVQVLLQMWHPHNHSWSVELRRTNVVHRPSRPQASWRFKHLQRHRVYTVQVAFKTSSGWSAYSTSLSRQTS